MPNLGRGLWTPPFWVFDGIFCEPERRSQGPSDALRPGTFSVRGGGILAAPSQVPFSHALSVLFPAPGFFLAFEARIRWIACWHRCTVNGMTNSESYSEKSPKNSETPKPR